MIGLLEDAWYGALRGDPDDIAWLHSDDEGSIFSFVVICENLTHHTPETFDPIAIRAAFATAEPAKRKRSSLIAREVKPRVRIKRQRAA